MTTIENKKTDRRVNRTRNQLRTALLDLILEKGYDAVTVEDITARADLGRTTFYLHYKDKEDLLMESINQMVDDLVARIEQIPLSAWKLQAALPAGDQEPATPFLLAFRHAADNADLYRVILRGSGNPQTVERLRKIIIEAVDRFIEVKAAREHVRLEARMSVPVEFFSNYLAGSFLGIATWWLENGMPYTPEEMTSMFQRTFFLGAFSVLNVSGENPV
jgi:AcrR family transcriptional regulator